MAHWFDDLARTVARSSVFGGFREAARRGSHGFTLLQSADDVTVETGPCGFRRAGNELTRRFTTQASTSDGQLLSYTTNTTHDLERGSSRTTAVVQRGSAILLEWRSTSDPDESQTFTIFFGSAFNGIREIRGSRVAGRLEGMINGHPWVPIALPANGEAPGSPAELRFADGTAIPEGTLSPDLLDELRDLANKAQREMPSCLPIPESFTPLSGSRFPGCDACMSDCEDIEWGCPLEVLLECGPSPLCIGIQGARCLARAADCYARCKNPPGVCCPQHCARNGFAECCAAGGTCCGARCCPDGQVCADAEHDLCCEPGSGPPCDTHCCQPGFKCASPVSGFCCAQDAGDFCTTLHDDGFLELDCCPPNQVCADSNIGLCCPRDHGPVCLDRCCKPGEVCRAGECCDPRLLCGDGERATCCPGECRDGECCRAPHRWVGDVCCPAFNKSCDVQGRLVCCGTYEECLREGCCPEARACGRRCCPAGHRCADYDAEECVACPRDTTACVTFDDEGRQVSLCCSPSVTCCVDRCCPPGETCCAPFGMPAACYPPEFCIH